MSSLNYQKLDFVTEPFNIIDVQSIDELDSVMDRLHIGQNKLQHFSQAKIDLICKAATRHFVANAEKLGLDAHNETGMGIAAHKTAKNIFGVGYVNEWYKNAKTCGVVDKDCYGETVASPMGIIAAVIPTTNPTSTVAFKALCCIKSRNAIIVAPHPRAKKATYDALRIFIEGAVAAGLPSDVAACISKPDLDLTNKLMEHPRTSCIMATGGPGMVKAAYSSGKPAIGVGPGNTPVCVDEEADLDQVVNGVLTSKGFDYAVICSSEQVLVVVDSVYNSLKEKFSLKGGYFLNEREIELIGDLLFKNGGMLNAEIVGKSPVVIAKMAGIDVPENTTLLIGEFDEIAASPFAKEKLSPVLGYTRASSVEDMFYKADMILKLGGEGHTACYYTNQHTQKDRIHKFGATVNVTRCLINQPTALGGIGGIMNFALAPSMTLGCGSFGHNYISDNVGPSHLINLKKVSYPSRDRDIIMHNKDYLIFDINIKAELLTIFKIIFLTIGFNPNMVKEFPDILNIFRDVKTQIKLENSDLYAVRGFITELEKRGMYELYISDNLLAQQVNQLEVTLDKPFSLFIEHFISSINLSDYKHDWNMTGIFLDIGSVEALIKICDSFNKSTRRSLTDYEKNMVKQIIEKHSKGTTIYKTIITGYATPMKQTNTNNWIC